MDSNDDVDRIMNGQEFIISKKNDVQKKKLFFCIFNEHVRFIIFFCIEGVCLNIEFQITHTHTNTTAKNNSNVSMNQAGYMIYSYLLLLLLNFFLSFVFVNFSIVIILFFFLHILWILKFNKNKHLLQLSSLK